ncbi:MAG: hypothetical protein ACPG5B_09295 [Chitinophagales bacterium]
MNVDSLLGGTIKEVLCLASRNTCWTQSLDLDLDKKILNRRIIAYQIQWFSGAWSRWYIPGERDIYQKAYEPKRRFWACFCDHTHRYLYRDFDDTTQEDKFDCLSLTVNKKEIDKKPHFK